MCQIEPLKDETNLTQGGRSSWMEFQETFYGSISDNENTLVQLR